MMKNHFIILFLIIVFTDVRAQNNEPSPEKEQKLENMTEKQDAQTTDDSYWQQLDDFSKHKINLNGAEERDLQDLQLLSALQIQNFFSYQKFFGKFLSIYELQAIPDWDIETIKSLLPYVMVRDNSSINETIFQRLQ